MLYISGLYCTASGPVCGKAAICGFRRYPQSLNGIRATVNISGHPQEHGSCIRDLSRTIGVSFLERYVHP